MQNTLGILGFGVVGKSAFKFFKKKYKDIKIIIWDQRDLTDPEKKLLKESGVNYAPLSFDEFCSINQKVFVSPGFDLDFLKKLDKSKILCELDLFESFYSGNSVAITGSLGKTTITSFLNQIFQKLSLNSCACGNIGQPLLNYVDNKELTVVFMELSSFQLRFSKKYTPNIAVFNNFYPNHLNWHKNLKDYFEAKCKIFEHQNKDQYSVFPINFLEDILADDLKNIFLEKIRNTESIKCFIGFDLEHDLDLIKKNNIKNVKLFSCKDKELIFCEFIDNKIIKKERILNLDLIPGVSFLSNWINIIAVLYLLNINMKNLISVLSSFEVDSFCEHRMELFLTKNDIDFYNDSKSTVFQATIKALEKLKNNGKPTILVLGGLSKGVDRTPLVNYLNSLENLKEVFCFGNDCCVFKQYKYYSSLEEVVDAILNISKQGDQVLFSPSGASFDLFENYMERGKTFKKLILEKFN
jgi:UDP-N-acetylmuramoylalanine--D-glutamate ligase